MMFPYPSAEGLHVGNIYAFTGADVFGRFKRMQGHDVFEPIGFDAFGIHSENFALKSGVHPTALIPANVANFRRQLRRIGGMFDWDHTVDTTDPDYYKWTQWLFLQLFKHGLAEQKEAPVNWCPSCMTVLANEQVVVGACERCGTGVEQRFIRQWFFRITEYAERLLRNLKHIDWSDTTLKAQRNWIGRSDGAELHFPVAGSEREPGRWAAEEEPGREPAAETTRITVFTTRPDTIFGATYVVLAPEHPLVDAVTSDACRAEVEAYRARTQAKDMVARKKIEKHKTGVFTGGYCINPVNGERVPVWIADYVLMGYGTGAIMAVPGHDERDFDFATTYELPIPRVIAAPGEDANTPLEIAYEYPTGTLVNSGRYDGLNVEDAKTAIVGDLASQGLAEAKETYRLHDWCISRQRYWGPPIPIIHCEACGPVAVPEEDLPVVLPRVEDFRPDATGVSPLSRVSDWYEVACPSCGRDATRETDVSDTFLDSAWYFLRYPSTDFPDRPFDPEITRRWLPGRLLHRRQRARRPSSALLALRRHGAARHGTARLRGAVRPVPRPRPHHPRGRQDVEEQGERDHPRPDHRAVRGGHLPSVPHVPRAVRRGRGLPGQGDLGSARLPAPPVGVGGAATTTRRPGKAPGPGGAAKTAPDDQEGYGTARDAPLQHGDRRDDGVSQRGARRGAGPRPGRNRAAGVPGGPLRAAHRRGTVAAAGPRGQHLRRRQLAGVRSRQGGREGCAGGRAG